MYVKMTEKEKLARREARKAARKEANQQAQIEAEKAQKPVKAMTITIEWKKSRTWGHNPNASVKVQYHDGTWGRFDGFKCSGCGYCKESTVIAQIFNHVLKYKLYQKHAWGDDRTTGDYKANHPYGVYYYGGGAGEKHEGGYISKPTYNGGVGTSCYRNIAEFIGGKFESVASGKSFDVFTYTDLN